MGYSDVYASWKADPEGFWMNAAKAIDWASPPSKALDDSNAPLYCWFTDTEVNTCYNAVDRHVENGRGDAYVVELRGTINRCGTVKPRHSVRRQEYEKWETRYLPARDFGLLILTTNSGVMHHNDAKDARIGGKLLAYVY